MRQDFFSRTCLFFIIALVRFLLSLRYRFEVVGLESLNAERFKKRGGILFLPNHPAEIDPVILEMVLWKKFKIRPLVVEHFYHLKGFRFFMDLVKAMPLPTMDILANKWRAKKVKKLFDQVVVELNKKGNFLIYPSGRLKVSGMELVGGASFVHDLLQASPDVNVVLVRTTGLWGSKFSKAITGSSPDFGKVLWECALILLKNGIFFAPKRDVRIEIEAAPADFPYKGNRLELNKYLEGWYNRYPEQGAEPLKLVSYAFWKEEIPQVAARPAGQEEVQIKPVPGHIQEEVLKEISRLAQRPATQIERRMHLSHDLGLDSLDIAEIYVFLDQRYDVTDLIPGDLTRVEDVMQAAAGLKKRKDSAVVRKEGKFHWPKETRTRVPGILSQQSIQEAFLLNCDLMKGQTACVDALSGVLSYRRLKLGALILADKFREVPGDRIGIMLPSSVGASLVVLAALLAGKVPVMINWTSGTKALDHAMEVSNIRTVITSDRFLDRLENGELGKIEEIFLCLEQLKETITFKDKLKGLFLSYRKASSLLKKLKLSHIKASDPAVLLFTSGTETLPKGVPLSHENILSNQSSALSCVNLQPDDILYCVLPPFHSFGFSVTGLLPLLAGLRACYAPDPTDSHGMAHDIERWGPTLFCCAPSFIRALFKIADPDKIQSLRMVVSGAEKTPQELFDYVKEHLPSSLLLEGYGITECSPIVTLDRPGEPHVGVGKPLPGVDIVVIDSATLQPLPRGVEGEIGIAGPNVFGGYFGVMRDPFVTVDGKKWYASGDRGLLDNEGHLILSGRLKRFVKIGGEMVSLGGLEDELLRLAAEKKWSSGGVEGPPLAVSVLERDSDKPQIILFTNFAIAKEDVNTALKESGYSRIVKVAEVKQLDAIPLTGTGKTHYRLLDETYLK
ncbi:MAG: AMP-binding protein [Verrucomicrobia bacterium]|nr:AMP-binding protein [Verrucomicrobiota bacterium]